MAVEWREAMGYVLNPPDSQQTRVDESGFGEPTRAATPISWGSRRASIATIQAGEGFLLQS